MAFRAKERVIAFLSGLLLAPGLFAQPAFQFEAQYRHYQSPHVKKVRSPGVLTIDSLGVSFQEPNGDAWHWDYQDIQQLKLAPKSLEVLTYQSDKWKLGADREYEFELVSGKSFLEAYNVLKGRLDQRFIAVLPERPADLLWEIPVKHVLAFGGDEGVLRVGTDAIVFSSEKKGASRTWRYEDIDNISSSGPFQLTITTFERAMLDYGNRKEFNFALKQTLAEDRFDDLWRRLNRSKGLKILSAYRQAAAEK